MGKEPPCNSGVAGAGGLILGLGRSPRERNGYPLQYSCLENPVDREAWQTTVHRVTKSWTQLKQLSMHIRNLQDNLLFITSNIKMTIV